MEVMIELSNSYRWASRDDAKCPDVLLISSSHI
jgi:hypothetical protein